jgi:hypothetical protein
MISRTDHKLNMTLQIPNNTLEKNDSLEKILTANMNKNKIERILEKNKSVEGTRGKNKSMIVKS